MARAASRLCRVHRTAGNDRPAMSPRPIPVTHTTHRLVRPAPCPSSFTQCDTRPVGALKDRDQRIIVARVTSPIGAIPGLALWLIRALYKARMSHRASPGMAPMGEVTRATMILWSLSFNAPTGRVSHWVKEDGQGAGRTRRCVVCVTGIGRGDIAGRSLPAVRWTRHSREAARAIPVPNPWHAPRPDVPPDRPGVRTLAHRPGRAG